MSGHQFGQVAVAHIVDALAVFFTQEEAAGELHYRRRSCLFLFALLRFAGRQEGLEVGLHHLDLLRVGRLISDSRA